MARRRRPGGGRKPHGKFPKDATFTTRLTSETRRALDERAKMSRLSVSATAERVLRLGLEKSSGKPRNSALGHAVALLAEKVEESAQKSWLEDPFTGRGLLYAIEALPWHFAPTAEGMPGPPRGIQEEAAKMPAQFAERFRTPAGFGHTLAFNLIHEIEQATSYPPQNEWSQPIFFYEKPEQLALIGGHLVLAEGKKGKSK